MDFVTVIMISLNILDCHGASLIEQLRHIAKVTMENTGYSEQFPQFRRFDQFHQGPNSVILGAPGLPSHLPEAEQILPGHTLIRPALGMLKSAVKFPHRDMPQVYGHIDNLGITYGGTNERVLYTGFRRAGNGLETSRAVPKSLLIIILDNRKEKKKNNDMQVVKQYSTNKYPLLRNSASNAIDPMQYIGAMNKMVEILRPFYYEKKNKESIFNDKSKPSLEYLKYLERYKTATDKVIIVLKPFTKLASRSSDNPETAFRCLDCIEHYNWLKLNSLVTANKRNQEAQIKDLKKYKEVVYKMVDILKSYFENQIAIPTFPQFVNPLSRNIKKKIVSGKSNNPRITDQITQIGDTVKKGMEAKKKIDQIIRLLKPFMKNTKRIGRSQTNGKSIGETNRLYLLYKDNSTLKIREVRRIGNDTPTEQLSEDITSETIEELKPHHVVDPNPKLTWFLNTQNFAHHIIINPDAPEFSDLMPVVPKDTDGPAWSYFEPGGGSKAREKLKILQDFK